MNPSGSFDDPTADAVLSGRGSIGDTERLPHDLAEVAAFAASLRSAAAVSPRPNGELRRILVEGLPSDHGALAAPVRSRPGRRRSVSEFVAGGLAAKAGLATAAVLGATAGAGAAGVLPDAIEEFRGEDRTETVVEEIEHDDPADVVADVVTDGVADGVADVAPEGRDEGIDAHDHRLGRAFGERVAEDASDVDEPGVDGAEVAEEASDGRSSEGRDRAEEASEGRSQIGRDAATRRSAPEDAPRERPTTPVPGAASERAEGADRAERPDPADGTRGASAGGRGR